MKKKTIAYIINGLYSGGAERVMTLLANMSLEYGYDVYLILADQKLADIKNNALEPRVNLISLSEEPSTNKYKFMHQSIIDTIYRFDKKLKIPPQDFVIYRRFLSMNRQKIKRLKKLLQDDLNTVLVAFLDYSIALALLAAKDLPNKVIVSERGNPYLHDQSNSASYFIRKHYSRADAIVFQTESAKAYFTHEIQDKSYVIPNPVREGLPEPYQGVREKVIVNFCRVSPEKNLPLLVRAFGIFWKDHKDYELHIIGDTTGAAPIINEIWENAQQYGVSERVKLIPFMENVHNIIRSYSIYVSSSDNEGMSNSMLEAMAIGLPCICTDCPSYGARQIIKNDENGILVEVGNEFQMANAMSKIADNDDFALKLSNEASKIRDIYSSKVIFDTWNHLFE